MTTQPMAEPTQPVPTFDPEIFWEFHKKKIILGAIVALLVLIGGGGYVLFQTIQNQKAAAAFSSAGSIDGWKAVINQFPSSVAAGNSYLRIAGQLRSDGKYQDSDGAYDTFVHQFPKHPLLVTAYMGLAANAELEKDARKALDHYKKITDQFGSSFEAPMALYNQGRLTEEIATATDQSKEASQSGLRQAQTLFESVVTRYPTSIAAQIAEPEAKRLAEKIAQESSTAPAPSAPAGSASPAAGSSPAASASPIARTPEP
jgi:outer membrane protein assembly factor BamD (BamD/ComL family)